MFVAGDKIIFLDVWSISGTNTMQRSNSLNACISTTPKQRNVLMFAKTEIIHLNVGKCIDIVIIPQTAIKKSLKVFAIYQCMKQIKKSSDDEKINDAYGHYNNKKKKAKKLSQKKQEFKNWICNELELKEYYGSNWDKAN
eukprot:UN13038